MHLLHSAVLCRIFAKRECQDDKGSRPRIKGSGRLDRTNDHRLVDALGALHVSERSKRALIAAFLDKIGPPLRPCDSCQRQLSAKLQEGAQRRRLLVAKHVTGGVGGYEFLTYFVQWATVVVSNGYDVALCPTHAWDFFVHNDGLAIPDE